TPMAMLTRAPPSGWARGDRAAQHRAPTCDCRPGPWHRRSRRSVAPGGERSGSALAVLRRLARLLQTGLLALRDARVTGQQASLLQGRAVQLGVHAVERARHAQTDGTGLAGGTTAVDAHQHVIGTVQLQDRQRLVDDLLVHLVGEVLL